MTKRDYVPLHLQDGRSKTFPYMEGFRDGKANRPYGLLRYFRNWKQGYRLDVEFFEYRAGYLQGRLDNNE